MYLDYKRRFYVENLHSELKPTFVDVGESKILILSNNILPEARDIVYNLRKDIIEHIERENFFRYSLIPIENTLGEPYIVKVMKNYSKIMNVGPMACVAGAIAQILGEKLFKGDDLIIENGGDIFIYKKGLVNIRVYTNDEVFKDKIIITVDERHDHKPLGIATSSATIGPSLSFGKTCATLVVSNNCALSDAAATRIANDIKTSHDLKRVLDKYKKMIYDFNIPILGVVCVIDSNMAIFGKIKVSFG
ncbi:ApbE family lipoprotein [Thermodesulfobium narugense DSM 14796]|uniref:ApbE family lipoprotein n=1 Tax=Thermodesulfobium narugense DSM 14796 TaxID=747365 RepID=M1E7C1_9BACT|nr:UPF0280 family protein [Thermodesulfobium narugense]AEE13914.1 ApbE family lipoprotein [Thermodesulfobium narugense DSM 14796]